MWRKRFNIAQSTECNKTIKFLLKNALPTPLGGCRHPENKYQIYQEVSDILLEGDWLDEFAGDFEVIPRDIQRME